MTTDTNPIIPATPEIADAVKRWAQAEYRKRHARIYFGVDTRPYRQASDATLAALSDVRRVVPRGPERHRVAGLVDDYLVGWNEAGDLEIKTMPRTA